MNSRKLFTELALKISLPGRTDEIHQLVFMVMGHVFGLSPTEILTGRKTEWSTETQTRIYTTIDRLNQHEPIQYILGEAEFYRRKFLVNTAVLIPRPETEELVHLIVSETSNQRKSNPLKILDIGTGSGCIAITLNLEMPGAEIFATDVSDAALIVAHQNARRLGARVEFMKHNILKEDIPILNMDIIVSNPPYIVHNEKSTIKPNVLDYEPHLALFVEGNDPLLFYKSIARKAKRSLNPLGKVVVEINEQLGDATAEVFYQEGYSPIIITKDINGKDRIVSATYQSA